MPYFVHRGMRSLVMTTSALVVASVAVSTVNAATEANTVIKNQALATYQDASGNEYQAQSNLAEVVVKQVYSATLSSDVSKYAASNQTVYSPHTLHNSGNGEETFTVAAANVTGDDGDYTSHTVYIDTNSNGVVDPGEEEVTGALTLGADEKVNLIVAAVLGTAVEGDEYASMLTVTPGTTGYDIADISSSTNAYSDTDPTDGAATNHVLATVTENAIIESVKGYSYDETTGNITYTITVTNKGSQPAGEVVLFDQIPSGTTLVSVANGVGFGTNTGDTQVSNGTVDETVYGVDLDGDGTTGTSADAVWGVDGELPVGASVKMTFVVQLDGSQAAGDDVVNIANVAADVDGDGTVDQVSKSNDVVFNTPSIISVRLDDLSVADGGSDMDGEQDGGDDGQDGTETAAVDVNFVTTAAAGSTVEFVNQLTNGSNTSEIFEVSLAEVAGSEFPEGTIFQFWNGSGTQQLLDTDGDGTPDTGPVAAGESIEVMVKAILPSGAVTTSTAMSAVLTVTSNTDETATSSVTSTLGAITAATVDLSNDSADDDSATNMHELDAGLTPITTLTADPGESVDFTLVLQNDGGSPDAFQLYAGSSLSGTGELGDLPDGWTVEFIDDSGDSVTTTDAIPGGGSRTVTARLTVPSQMEQALADYVGDVDADGTEDRFFANGDDSLGDYPIFFVAASASSGATDVKLDAVIVNEVPAFTVEADQSSQISPGGNAITQHLISNTGNTAQSLTLGSSNSGSGDGWGESVKIDTDGDGIPDTPYAALTDGDTVWVEDVNGVLYEVTVTGPAGSVAIPLQPGDVLPVSVDTNAPTNAPNGSETTVVLTVTNSEGETEDAQLNYSVVLGKLDLAKAAALDAACDGTPDNDFQESGHEVEPGECVVWQIVATNTGIDSVSTIEIADAVPAYTTYLADSAQLCAGDAGDVAATPDCTLAAASTEVTVDGDDVTFDLSGLNMGATDIGGSPVLGDLAPGSSVTVRFATQVE